MKLPKPLCVDMIEKMADYTPDESNIIKALEKHPIISMVFSSDLKKYWYSDAWYKYLGWTHEAMSDWAWGDFLPEPFVPASATRFYQFMMSGENWNDLYPILGADGKYRQFLCQAAAVHDKKGDVSFWLGSMIDVTDLSAVVTVGKLYKR